MNKKKFFATCTLVAFGATMVPAMAFATTTKTNNFCDGSTKFVDLVDGEGYDVAAPDNGEVSWLTDDDTLSVMYLPEDKKGVLGEDVTSKFKIKPSSINQGAADGKASLKLQSTEGAVFAPGFYLVSVKDKQDPTTNATPIEFDDINASMDATHSVSYEPSVDAKGDITLNGGKVGVLSITEASKTSVYDLGEKGYSQIQVGAKPVATITSNKIDAEKLKVGHTYGLLTATSISDAVYPQDYFVYDKATADKVDKSITAAKKLLDAELAKVGSLEAVVTGTSVTLTPTAKTGMNFDTAKADVFIVGCDNSFNVNGKSVITPASFDGTLLSGNAKIDASDMQAAKQLVKNGDVSGKATVVVQLKPEYSSMRSDKMEIDLTLTSQKTDQEKMKAFADENGLTSYDQGIAADLTDDTATMILSKVDEGFILTDGITVESSSISYELFDYFDAKTGKVTKIPEKDVKDDIEIAFAAGGAPLSAVGKITVALTIKADGSVDPTPSDKEEAQKVFMEKSRTFMQIADEALGDDDVITPAELRAVLEAYDELLVAYRAYAAL